MLNFLNQVSNYAIRELVYLPKRVLNPYGVPADAHRMGMLPSEILEQAGADENQAN